METNSQSTPCENKDVSKLNDGEMTSLPLAKEFVGLETKEDSGDKKLQNDTPPYAHFTYDKDGKLTGAVIVET